MPLNTFKVSGSAYPLDKATILDSCAKHLPLSHTFGELQDEEHSHVLRINSDDFSLFLSCRTEVVPVHGISETIVGVLGGGQLGRMLCQAASKMAIKIMTLDPLENCPASAIAFHHVVGSFDDGDTVREFAKRWIDFIICFFFLLDEFVLLWSDFLFDR